MFGYKKIARSVKELEAQLAVIVNERNCKNGEHQWEFIDSSYINTSPYIRCSHCSAKPPEKKP